MLITQEQKSILSSISDCFTRITACAENTANLIAEAQWADTFHALTGESSWLKDKAFSPGRWAVGYQYLCALYRILDEMKPKCVLDLGLGQSTKMISQYAAANPRVRHVVVESSMEWVDFFKNSGFALAPNTRIVHCNYSIESFKGVNGVRVYENFLSALQGYKFDFISIDAPLSGDMKTFGRVDVVKLIPNHISKRYAILFDDTGRKPDNAGFQVLVEALTTNGFSARIGCFHGLKWCSAVVSSDMQFLLSNASRRFDSRDSKWQEELVCITVARDNLYMTATECIREFMVAHNADELKLKEAMSSIEVRFKEMTRQCIAANERFNALNAIHNATVVKFENELAVADAAIKKRDRLLDEQAAELAESQDSIKRLTESYQRDLTNFKARLASAEEQCGKLDVRIADKMEKYAAKLKERLAVADAAIVKRDRLLEGQAAKIATSQDFINRLKKSFIHEESKFKARLASAESRCEKLERWLVEKTKKYVAADEKLKKYKEVYRRDVESLKGRLCATEMKLADCIRALKKEPGAMV